MAEILFIKQFPLGVFFKRRFSRVYPGLAVMALITAIIFASPGPLHISKQDIIATLTFIYNYFSIYEHHSPVLDHVWSLCIEEHSYVALGILAFSLQRDSRRARMVAFTLTFACVFNGIVQTWVQNHGYYAVYWRTDVRAASILMGFTAYLYLRERVKPARSILDLLSPVFLFILGALLNFSIVPDPIKYSLGTACIALCLCLLDSTPLWIRAILENPVIVRFGLWSYSLYIWQQMFFELKLQNYVSPFLLLVSAIVCGVSSFYLIERPARRWLNVHWGAEHVGKSVT